MYVRSDLPTFWLFRAPFNPYSREWFIPSHLKGDALFFYEIFGFIPHEWLVYGACRFGTACAGLIAPKPRTVRYSKWFIKMSLTVTNIVQWSIRIRFKRYITLYRFHCISCTAKRKKNYLTRNRLVYCLTFENLKTYILSVRQE